MCKLTRRVLLTCLALSGIVFGLLSRHPVQAALPGPAPVEQLMEISGITAQYGDIPEDISASLQQQRQEFAMLTDEDFNTLSATMLSIFNTPQILSSIRDEIDRTLTDKDIMQLMTWYNSDMGRKITRIEIDSSTQAAQRRMMALKELQLTKTKRVTFARRFDKMLNLSQFAAEYYEIQQEALMLALNQLMYPEQLVDPLDYKKQVARYRLEIREQAEEMIIVSVVYTYRKLSDKELEKYMEFNRQPYSVKLSEAVFNGALKAMRRMLEQLTQNQPGNTQ